MFMLSLPVKLHNVGTKRITIYEKRKEEAAQESIPSRLFHY